MPYGKQLATTGVATATIGGLTFTYPWIAAIAAAVIVTGGICIRLTYKVRNK